MGKVTANFVPVREVFDLLGVHSNTGYLLIKRGEFPIPVVHIGRRMFCRPADVWAFVEGGPEEPWPSPGRGSPR